LHRKTCDPEHAAGGSPFARAMNLYGARFA
jgi:hypothetical protein